MKKLEFHFSFYKLAFAFAISRTFGTYFTQPRIADAPAKVRNLLGTALTKCGARGDTELSGNILHSPATPGGGVFLHPEVSG
jgi:hypothetical protein